MQFSIGSVVVTGIRNQARTLALGMTALAAVMGGVGQLAPAAAHDGGAHYCLGRVATIVGTDGYDYIQGTPGNDRIFGNGGPDVICAGAGNDNVDGGTGNDIIMGEDGTDSLRGREGDDYLRGGNGFFYSCESVIATPSATP